MHNYRLLLPAALLLSDLAIAHPVPLPNPHIPGYSFPESESQLMDWINQQTPANTRQIYRHGWGLWASLTAPSGQSEFDIPNVPVYLTWLTPAEVAALPSNPEQLKAQASTPRQLQLRVPRQFQRVPGFQEKLQAKKAELSAKANPSTSDMRDTSVFEMVAYDPAAAEFARKNQLFSKAELTKIYDAGNASIPAFPSNAVTIKPVYKLVSKANMIKGSSLYVMPAWPGTPKVTPDIEKNGFSEDKWPGCVYIDAKNPGKSKADRTDPSCSHPNASNTFALGDFIAYPVTADNVKQFQQLVQDQLKQSVEVGDALILMAMHVTTREITEWTWQTFFWTPNPAKPPLPGNRAAAAARPAQVAWPAAHYAMSIGYQMVAPNQPINGGKSVGQPVTVYNPYLESDFNAATFTAPPVNVGIYSPVSKRTFHATVGVQTNCMTCHSGASVQMDSKASAIGYSTNFYIPRNAPMFKGNLQTDFLWSIADDAK
ncbi:hypothetical protein C2134_09515 [Chromobacterium sinusclupearum]|uniref:Cytochrome P460 domain-containing protein n=1 Tax=Chromobacterium sinusclupearum TaxID=2077146 RepID=A0A2K4MP74_9NEIS|nr:hypothetical protein [Chromobacterium sinusclupearum]POA98894.1 hypothetical protein C2134_09515 [Chromobacterium sinusclupearum]